MYVYLLCYCIVICFGCTIVRTTPPVEDSITVLIIIMIIIIIIETRQGGKVNILWNQKVQTDGTILTTNHTL